MINYALIPFWDIEKNAMEKKYLLVVTGIYIAFPVGPPAVSANLFKGGGVNNGFLVTVKKV